MADCSIINKKAIEDAKKEFGENVYALIAKYGSIDKIPASERLPYIERATNFEELYKAIITKEFNELEPFYEFIFKNLIKTKTDEHKGKIVLYENPFINKTTELEIIDISETKTRVGVIESASGMYTPSDKLKESIIEDLKRNDITPANIVSGVYNLFGIMKEKKQVENRLSTINSQLTHLKADLSRAKAKNDTAEEEHISARINKMRKQIEALKEQLKDLSHREIVALNEKHVVNAVQIIDKETLYENMSNIIDLTLYDPVNIPNASDFLKTFVVLKNRETGQLVLFYPFAGRYDNRKTSIMGRYSLPQDIAKEADLYANTSNFINMKMYLASLELLAMGYKIERSISSNVFQSFRYRDVPILELELCVFDNRVSALMNYVLGSLTDITFASSIKKAREVIATPPDENIEEEINFFDSRLKIVKVPEEERESYISDIRNGNYEAVLENLLSLANSNKKLSNKEKMQAIVDMIARVQEKDLSEELKERVYDDPSISMWIKDANQVQNYWIQSIMDMVNEKLFITKKNLLPFYNKVNKITEKIIAQFPDEKMKNKVNPFADGSVFFKNLIADDSTGEFAGRYIYVNPERGGKWAKSWANQKGWNNLSEAEKEFSELFTESIRKAYIDVFGENMYEAKWEDGLIPIMKKRESVQLKESLKNKNWEGVKEAFFRMHMFQNDFNEVISEASQKNGVPNYYMYTNKEEHAEEYYRAIGDYGAVEHDLYSILLRTVGNLEKKKNFDKIEGYFRIIRKLANKQTQDDGYTKNENTLKLLDAIYEKYWLQRNKRINTGNRRYNNEKTIRKILSKSGMSNVDIDNIFSAISKYSSMLTIALSPANDVKNFIQGFLRALSRGLSGTLNKLYGGDSPFTVQELLEGYKFVFSAIADKRKRELLGQLLKVSNMYQSDFMDFTDPRFKQTDERSYLFRSNVFYILNYLGDYANRGAVAYAIINKEIGIDAYTLDEENNLVYNEELDKRYHTEEGRMILEYIKSTGGTHGIDFRIANNMKRISNETFGSYDGETLRLIEQYSLGKLIMQFRRYLPDYLYESYAKGKYVRVNGKYKVIDGKVVWDGEYYEGTIRSMFSVINRKVLNKMEGDVNYKMSKKQQENIAKLASDILFLIGIYLLYVWLSGVGDEDDDKYGIFGNAKNKQRFYSMAFDFVQTINPNTFSSILNSPFAVGRTINRINSVMNNLFKASFYYIEGDSKKSEKYLDGFEDGLFKITPYASSYYKFRADLEDILWDTSDIQYR